MSASAGSAFFGGSGSVSNKAFVPNVRYGSSNGFWPQQHRHINDKRFASSISQQLCSVDEDFPLPSFFDASDVRTSNASGNLTNRHRFAANSYSLSSSSDSIFSNGNGDEVNGFSLPAYRTLQCEHGLPAQGFEKYRQQQLPWMMHQVQPPLFFETSNACSG